MSKKSMSGRDVSGAHWLEGRGHDKQLARQLERRERDRQAEREVALESGCGCVWCERRGHFYCMRDVVPQFRLPDTWEEDIALDGQTFWNDTLDDLFEDRSLTWRSEQMPLEEIARHLGETGRMSATEVEDFLTK